MCKVVEWSLSEIKHSDVKSMLLTRKRVWNRHLQQGRLYDLVMAWEIYSMITRFIPQSWTKDFSDDDMYYSPRLPGFILVILVHIISILPNFNRVAGRTSQSVVK